MLDITEVEITRTFAQKQSRLRALASIKIENLLAIHDIKIIEEPDRWFIAMPSRTSQDGKQRDMVHPIGQKFKDEMESIILAEYRKWIDKHGMIHPNSSQNSEEMEECHIVDDSIKKRA